MPSPCPRTAALLETACPFSAALLLSTHPKRPLLAGGLADWPCPTWDLSVRSLADSFPAFLPHGRTHLPFGHISHYRVCCVNRQLLQLPTIPSQVETGFARPRVVVMDAIAPFLRGRHFRVFGHAARTEPGLAESGWLGRPRNETLLGV